MHYTSPWIMICRQYVPAATVEVGHDWLTLVHTSLSQAECAKLYIHTEVTNDNYSQYCYE